MRAFRDVLRLARRQPGFVGLVVLTLGIGIAGTTVALNLAHTVLWKPLPVRDESGLILITKGLPAGATLVPFSYREMAAWRDASRTATAIAGVQYDGAWPWTAVLGGDAQSVHGAVVSGNFFELLDMQPAAGRLLRDEDERPGTEAVVVIGHRLWRRAFDGDPSVAGTRVRLNGRRATVVGVAPADFSIPRGAEIWQPLIATTEASGEGWFNLVARLHPTATIASAAEESSGLLIRLRDTGRTHAPANLRTSVVPLKSTIVGGGEPVVAVFAGAAVLLLAIGCINVVNMLLVRGIARRREIAIRAALGASAGRLTRDFAAESACLAALGGTLGVFLAFWLQRVLVALAPATLPRVDQLTLDARVVVAAALISLLAALVAGGLPAVWAARQHPSADLRTFHLSPASGRRTERARQLLVGIQVSLAVVASLMAVLLGRSLHELQRVPLGFSTDGLTIVDVPLSGPAYTNTERRLQLFEALVSRLEALPGVTAATPVLLRPFTGRDGWDATFTAEGQGQDEAGANPGLHLEAVFPNYFTTLGASLESGRAFTDADRDGAVPVAIVSRALARRAWPDRSAVGGRLKFGGADSPAPWMTVVGVSDDLHYRDLTAPPPAIYVPMRQAPFPGRFLLVRATASGGAVLPLVRAALAEYDAAEPVPGATPVQSLLDSELAAPRFHLAGGSLFAAMTLLLVGLGIFGVLTAFVVQQSRELGVRVALGATRQDLWTIVASKTVWPVSAGLVVGTLLAFAALPLVTPLLFRISGPDAGTVAAAWAALAVAAMSAAVIPLRRASRVDPRILLQAE